MVLRYSSNFILTPYDVAENITCIVLSGCAFREYFCEVVFARFVVPLCIEFDRFPVVARERMIVPSDTGIQVQEFSWRENLLVIVIGGCPSETILRSTVSRIYLGNS